MGVRPVGNPRTMSGCALSAAAIWPAFVFARMRSSLNIVTFSIQRSTFGICLIGLVCGYGVAAPRFRERQADRADRGFDAQKNRAASRRRERQPPRQLLFQP